MLSRKLGLIVAAVAITSVIAAPSFAQRRKGGARNAAARVYQIPSSVLKSVLNLTDDQTSQIDKIELKLKDDVQALKPAPGTQAAPDAKQKLADLNKKAIEEITAVLTPDQKAKAKDALKPYLALTGAGIHPAALTDIKLTDDQKAKIDAIVDEYAAKFKGLSKADRQVQAKQLNTERNDKIKAVLTADQLAANDKAAPKHGKKHAKKAA